MTDAPVANDVPIEIRNRTKTIIVLYDKDVGLNLRLEPRGTQGSVQTVGREHLGHPNLNRLARQGKIQVSRGVNVEGLLDFDDLPDYEDPDEDSGVVIMEGGDHSALISEFDFFTQELIMRRRDLETTPPLVPQNSHRADELEMKLGADGEPQRDDEGRIIWQLKEG